MNLFADNRTIQPDCDLINVSVDRSIDEGAGIVQIDFEGPSMLSTGREYYVQASNILGDVEALIGAIEVGAEGVEDPEERESVFLFLDTLTRARDNMVADRIARNTMRLAGSR